MIDIKQLCSKINKELGHPILNTHVREGYVSKLIDQASVIYDDEVTNNHSLYHPVVKDVFIIRYVMILVKEDIVRFNKKFGLTLFGGYLIEEEAFIKDIENDRKGLYENLNNE